MPKNFKIASAVGRGGLNRTQDQEKIRELLFRIDQEDGGPESPYSLAFESPVENRCGVHLQSGIDGFQKKNVPAYHCDGRVDPGGGTLGKMNAKARDFPRVAPGSISVPATLDVPPEPGPLRSTWFKVRLLTGMSGGEGISADLLMFQFADPTNHLSERYLYTAVGMGWGPLPVSGTDVGPWNTFHTPKPWSLEGFGGPARFTTVGGGPFSINTLHIPIVAGEAWGVYIQINTGTTIGVGASTTAGLMIPSPEGVRPYSGG